MTDEQKDLEYRADQLRMRSEYQRHLLRVAGWDAGMRMALAVVLVVGLLGVVAVGVVNKQAASELSPLVAPLASLAGLAVGYFFGQGSASAPPFDEPTERRE